MEAVCRARDSKTTIARNQLVVNTGDAVIAGAGGAGTLSEIAFSWQFNKKIICYSGFQWSERLEWTWTKPGKV